MEQLTANLNQGQGTMGQLMNDKQLYDNLNRTVTEMQSLLADIRKDPKKYPELQDEHLLSEWCTAGRIVTAENRE